METNKRYSIEECNNGWIVKITETGNDKFVGRYVFTYLGELMEFLTKQLEPK